MSDFGPNVELHESIGSTQDRAFELGEPGRFVVAFEQTAGRGRLGRSWSQRAGLGVGISMAVEADQHPLEQWSVRGGVAAAVACERLIASAIDASVGIKWPNDVLVDGRKLAGVLVEVRGPLAVVGVGVNVRHEPSDWPSGLTASSVSLAMFGVDVPAAAVAGALVEALRCTRDQPIDRVVEAWTRRDAIVGSDRRFRVGQEFVAGSVERIDPLREIVVRTTSGRVAIDPRLAELVKD